jgi:hypothetical protein
VDSSLLSGLIILVAVWAAFWWFPEFRTFRTVVVLALATAILLIAWQLPAVASLAVSVATAAALLAIHLRFNQWIAAYTPDELAFNASLSAINNRLSDGYDDGVASRDPGGMRISITQAIGEVEDLTAPGAEWEDVRLLALELLRDRLALLDADDASPKARVGLRSKRAELHERLRRTRLGAARFWR